MTGDDELDPLHINQARARAFGQVADLYDRTRPGYPDEFVDVLLAGRTGTVLDVGCGTGIVGRKFAKRGCSVLGVEPDELMAAVARRSGLDVEVATFEEWVRRDRTFDLLVAGQAWHWVNPGRGALAAADAVAPGGTAALVWNDARMPDTLTATLKEVYVRYAPEFVTPVVIFRPAAKLGPDAAETRFPATGRFGDPVHRSIPWKRTYTTEEWIDQLHTHSDHLLMEPRAREKLLTEVGRVLDDKGGSFEMDYACSITTFARLDGN